jgi:hypothetical protein
VVARIGIFGFIFWSGSATGNPLFDSNEIFLANLLTFLFGGHAALGSVTGGALQDEAFFGIARYQTRP